MLVDTIYLLTVRKTVTRISNVANTSIRATNASYDGSGGIYYGAPTRRLGVHLRGVLGGNVVLNRRSSPVCNAA